MKKKIPENIRWELDARDAQKVEVLFDHFGITQGTQLVKMAISQLYNSIKDAHYNQKHGPQFGSAEHQ